MAAVDNVYATLRERIINGVLEPGAKLGEEELAAFLGVSRTPIREALRRMASDGLIETVPNRGARVRTWSDEELRSLFATRALLEGHASRLAASRVSDEQYARLAELCDEMEAARERDLGEVTRLNDEFHLIIRGASGDPIVPDLIKGLIQVPVVARTFRSYGPERMSRSMVQHREVLAALAAGDGDWAESAMRTHVLSAGNWLLSKPPAESPSADRGSER